MKVAVKLCCLVLFLLLAFVTAVAFLLQTSYSKTIVGYAAPELASHGVRLADAKYIFPNRLNLKQLTIVPDSSDPVIVDSAVVTIDAKASLTRPLSVSNLTLSGINLPGGMASSELTELLATWQPERIEVQELDFANQDFVARGMHLVYQPEGTFPQGQMSLSCDQVYWQGEAFNNLRSKINISEQEWLVDQLAFQWRDGDIQLIAQRKQQDWIINDVMIQELRLSKDTLPEAVQHQATTLFDRITRIEHLAVYQSSWQQPGLELNQVTAELLGWHPGQNYWQQDSFLSLRAESVIWDQFQLLEPQLDIQLSPQQLDIERIRFLFEQGRISASGRLTPESTHLTSLKIADLEWIIDENQDKSAIWQHLSRMDDIQLDRLHIERSQAINLNTKPSWQVSNLNVIGEGLQLKQQQQWALWDGRVTASANSISAFGTSSMKPYMEMENNEDKWQIKQLFLPLNQGLVEISSEMDLSLPSYPWQLNLSAFGLPLKQLTSALSMPAQWSGLADVSATLSGLGGDELMLRHSLSGKVAIAPHDVAVSVEQSGPHTSTMIIPEVLVSADRGVIKVPQIQFIGNDITGSIEGQIDLLETDKGKVEIQMQSECVTLTTSLPERDSQIINRCPD